MRRLFTMQPDRPSWAATLSSALAASLVAMGVMFWLRAAYQVRTIPERVVEWALLFVPLDVFEKGIETLGTEAKKLALDIAVVGMTVALVLIAIAVFRKGVLAILLAPPVLWLTTMLVILPLIGVGFFGAGLFQDRLLTDAGFGLAVLAYGTILLMGRAILTPSRTSGLSVPPVSASRRALLGGIVSTGAALIATLWLGRSAGSSSSDLPLATLPTSVPASGQPSRPAPTMSTAPPAEIAATGATPTLAPAEPDTFVPPPPSPKRSLERDKDGSLTASARQPGELAPLITPIPIHYITTKNAGGDPVVDPTRWRIVVDGEVERPVQVDLALLYQLPSVQVAKTLECISNYVNACEAVPFGCDLISTARWKGVRLSDVLALAGGVKSSARSLAVFGADEFSSSLPVDADFLSEVVLVYQMNGEVLPIEHGYPARLLVPGRYGMKSPKWVVGLRPMPTEYVDWYGQRNWNRQAVVKTMTRIDEPGNGLPLPLGTTRIAGIAYAGSRGVARVEFSVDGGQTWQPTNFVEQPLGGDTWVRWEGTFEVGGQRPIQLLARAVDGEGGRQDERYTNTQPDGATGLHSIQVFPVA